MYMDKGSLLKTTGWLAVGTGLLLITLGTMYDDDQSPRPSDDNVIDVEWYEVEE
jgi:hypothetical protein